MSNLTIRELTTMDDMRRAEESQRVIWAMPDSAEVAPAHLLLTVQKNGGLIAGAFDEAGEMVGFVFGFLGRAADGHWKHCSHMMGVLPEQRKSGIGDCLKRYQREFVLRQGLDLITWTFDPLEGVNASLNFGKLGVVCRSYQRDLYGSLTNELNQGLPSDRFEVEWWIASRRVTSRLAQESIPPRLAELAQAGVSIVNPLASGRSDDFSRLREQAAEAAATSQPQLLIEAPGDFQGLKAASPDTARAWRTSTREVFEQCFRAGYIAAEFISDRTGAGRRNFYLLQRAVPNL